MNYYRRYWEDSTGDELTHSWGKSIWYFETDENSCVLRQVIVFETGQILKYAEEYPDDEFGGLSDQPLDPDEFEASQIEMSEFEINWDRAQNNSR